MKRKIVIEIDALASRCGKCKNVRLVWDNMGWCSQFQPPGTAGRLEGKDYATLKRCSECIAAEKEANK